MLKSWLCSQVFNTGNACYNLKDALFRDGQALMRLARRNERQWKTKDETNLYATYGIATDAYSGIRGGLREKKRQKRTRWKNPRCGRPASGGFRQADFSGFFFIP